MFGMHFIKASTLVFFILLIFVICLIQYILLKPVMLTGFALDDWGAVLTIKSLMPFTINNTLNSFWNYLGIHHTMQFFYIGTLFTLIGFDYPTYNLVNIVFKILATITIFPLVLLVFKSKPLALLTTIVHSISYAATGALTYVLQGVYYIGIIFMNVFFIFYYLGVAKKSKLNLMLASISLILSYWFAPGRIYPILFLILLIEVFLNFKSGYKNMLKGSFIRLTLFYLPLVLLMVTGKKDYSQIGTASQTFLDILNGNWRITLNPLSGLGNLFLPGNYWEIFGDLRFKNIGEFAVFLSKEYLFILIPITIILNLLIFKKLKFTLLILSSNLFISILIYFIATHHLSVPLNLQIAWDETVFWKQQYYSLFGVYILTIAIACFIVYWKKKTKENLIFLAAALGPIFAFIFLLGLWVILGRVMTFYGGINRYFPIASLGGSLFIAAILTIIYKRTKKWSFGIIGIFLLAFFLISSNEINQGFRGINVRNSYLHKQFQENFLSQLDVDKIRQKKYVLFYFDLNEKDQKTYFEEALDTTNLARWMYLRLNDEGEKCFGIIYDTSQIKESSKILSPCINKWDGISSFQSHKEVNFSLSDFYAFRVTDNNFFDITNEVLKNK